MPPAHKNRLGDTSLRPPHLVTPALNSLFHFFTISLGTGSGTISLRGSRDGDCVEVLVADDGPGLVGDDLARVMDPFFSGKGDPEASGLGMFMSYTIVQNHGGQMEVDSAPGEGFSVRIRMPVPRPDPPGEPDGP